MTTRLPEDVFSIFFFAEFGLALGSTLEENAKARINFASVAAPSLSTTQRKHC
jgi:hypothetical protein